MARKPRRWGRFFRLGPKRAPARRTNHHRLCAEPLETRTLLAVTITGTATVAPILGDQMLIRDAEVDITVPVGPNAWTTVTGATNDQGVYTIPIPFSVGTGRFAGEIFAKGPVPYQVLNTNGGKVFESSSFSGNQPTGLVGGNYKWDVRITSFSPGSAQGAFELFTTLYSYYHYAVSRLGLPTPIANPLSVNYPCLGGGADFTAPGPLGTSVGVPCTINFAGNPTLDQEMLGHEFGHYVAYEFGFNDPFPNPGSTTNWGTTSAFTWAARCSAPATCKP